MKKNLIPTLLLAYIACCVASAGAAVKYWDLNGDTAGAGGTKPAGTWDTTTANWNEAEDGTSAATTFAANDVAVFSAGDDATGAYNLTGTGNAFSAVTIEEGAVTLKGTAFPLGAGTWTVKSGAKLIYAGTGSFPFTASEGSVLVLDGGLVRNTVTGSGGNFLGSSSAGANTKIYVTENGGSLDVKDDTLSIVLQNNVISGPGGITKAGIGTLAIQSKCTYEGETAIAAGTVRIRTYNNRLPTSTAVTITSSGTLDLDGYDQTIGSLSGDGTVILDGVSTAGTLIVGGDSTTAAPFSGVIRETSGNPSTVTKQGPGTLTLSGPNTYAGRTLIQEGKLIASSLNRGSGGSASSSLGAPSSPANGNIRFGNAGTTGTLIYTGAGETTDRVIDLYGTTGGATIQNDGSGAIIFTTTCKATGDGDKTLRLQGSNADANEIAKIVDSSPGATAVTKAGTGTWILCKLNTYTGGTVVTDGLLEASVAGAIPGNVNITAGTLKLSDPSAMSSSGNLTLADSPVTGAVDLNFTGTQRIAALYFGAAAQAAGVWGPLGSGAAHENGAFTGTGLLFVNSAPVAPAAKSQSTMKDIASAILKQKLLTGASDAESDPLSVSAAGPSSTQGGTLAVQADDVLYTPPAGYTGPDSYTYTISDGVGGTAIGTVNVTVTDNSGGSPNIVSVSGSGGGFSLTFAGIPNTPYTVQRAPTATGPWAPLASPLNPATTGGNGLCTVVDDPSSDSFYRVVYP